MIQLLKYISKKHNFLSQKVTVIDFSAFNPKHIYVNKLLYSSPFTNPSYIPSISTSLSLQTQSMMSVFSNPNLFLSKNINPLDHPTTTSRRKWTKTKNMAIAN